MTSFAKVPNSLVSDPSVSDGAVRVYACLREHVWRFEQFGEKLPTMAALAKQLGRSTDTVQRAIAELEAKGWLQREKTGNRTVWMRLNNVAKRRWVTDAA